MPEASQGLPFAAAAAFVVLLGCDSNAGVGGDTAADIGSLAPAPPAAGAAGDAASAVANGSAATAEPPPAEALAPGFVDFGSAVEPSDEAEVCAAIAGESELRRMYLAFALDVSASMGNDEERFRLKWQPVVQASEAFFSEADSAGVSASLTFFPGESSASSCSDATYAVPNVPQTLLPSAAFADAIGALALTPTARWRTSTPTLAAFNGIAASLASITDPGPRALPAIVLVTDGVPQGCGADDTHLQLLVEAVRSSGILTFVVGVGNPPQAGVVGNLTNLNLIAEAGGTEHAFIVETGDAARTEADFKAVIDRIRGFSIPCNIEIPLPPTGAQFIADHINVTYGSAGAADLELSYDAACVSPNSWRYDNPDAPLTIVLCDDICGSARRDVSARLVVEFGCERRNVIR